MKKKATPKRASLTNAAGNGTISEHQPLRQTKPSNAPAGRGLGKAGAKRLGRLLKQVMQHREEQPPGREKVSLPKTPVRRLKHQIQSEASNAPKKNSSKMASPQVSKLIISVVSQCKQKDGISMEELKQTLAAEGYNVKKNNRQVKVVTKRLVDSETLVRTTRHASFRITSERLLRTTRRASVRINQKTLAETGQVKTNPVKMAKPKREVKQSTIAHKSPKREERPRRRTEKTRGKSHIPKGKTQIAARSHQQPGKPRKPAARSHQQPGKPRKPAARSHQQPGKPRKPAAKSHQQPGKPRKPAAKSHQQPGKPRKPAAKSHRQRTLATKSRRKQQKPRGKKRRTAKKQIVKPRRPQRKARRI